MSKKNWLKERLDEGLVFLKGNVRGKCFIEYIPAEYAWVPIEAGAICTSTVCGYPVSSRGMDTRTSCWMRASVTVKRKGKKGLVILSPKKKMGFLSDPKYMGYKGFQTADAAEPYFELMYLLFEEDAPLPCFRDTVRRHGDMPEGFVLYYTNQCPFTAKYVPILEEMAKARNAVFQSIQIRTREDAWECPSPFTTFSLFYDGQHVTHEILSEKKFDKILVSKGL